MKRGLISLIFKERETKIAVRYNFHSKNGYYQRKKSTSWWGPHDNRKRYMDFKISSSAIIRETRTATLHVCTFSLHVPDHCAQKPVYYPGHHQWLPPPQFSSVQSLSRIWLFATPWIAACQASPSITNSRSSPRLTSIESVMPSSHLILCRPLLLLPPIPPSIRVFSNESTLPFRWPKYWSFSFSISPSIEIPGLVSFRMDWLDLLAVQGTLKSLLQHHS